LSKKFIFFDIECIQVASRDYIFSFGYVLCDQDFKVIKQEDILINPNIHFQVSTGVKIHYGWNKISSQPTFIEFYEQIKSLLEDPNHQVMGHAIDNDIKFLYQECEEYKLPGFNFNFVDTQVLYDDFHHLDKRTSIETILNNYQIKPEILHRSDMDAFYNMVYVQKMCSEFKLNLEQIVDNPRNLKGLSKGLNFERFLIKDWINKPTRVENKEAMLERIDYKTIEIVTDKLNNKIFVINTILLYENLDIGLYIIKTIIENGGKFQQFNTNPSYFIYEDNSCIRQTSFQNRVNWSGSFLTVKELFNEVGLIHGNITLNSIGIYESMLLEASKKLK